MPMDTSVTQRNSEQGGNPNISLIDSKGYYTVQITFIFIGQTRLVFGNRVCTCVTKHSNTQPKHSNVRIVPTCSIDMSRSSIVATNRYLMLRKNKLERVGCPQPQSCPPAWEQDEMLINE